MIGFDISEYVFPSSDDSEHGLEDITNWLDQNVGAHDADVKGLTAEVIRKGKGWEIQTLINHMETDNGRGYSIISWHCHIEDPEKALLFALKWIK